MTQFNYSSAALRWLESVLYEYFGHEFFISDTGEEMQLKVAGSDRFLLFDQLQSVFHQSRSDFPCYIWRASNEDLHAPVEDSIPAPSEHLLPELLVESHELGITIHYDILGLVYWMMTRMEEVGCKDLDIHQRFPATSSHAYKYGYLERPIVDEWLNILGQLIKRVWPIIDLKQHNFTIKTSHDVDSPSQYYFKSWPYVVKAMGGHLLKRRDIVSFFKAPCLKLATGNKLHPSDSFNTFEWLMDISEENNLKSAFYFICGRTDPFRDADYEPEHPVIRSLMRSIHDRGHEIGLHPSYNVFQQPELLKQEALRLKRICSEELISQSEWGGRMHFLRWEQPTTLRAWAAAGMSYDSTLGYADLPGFRCGTCHEYPAFDPIAQEILDLRIRPLIVMECTVIAKHYMGLGAGEKAEMKFNLLKNRCASVNGTFTVLWHNSFLGSKDYQCLYKKILS